MNADPFDLQRFVTAQDGQDPHHPGISWDGIVAELAAGHKRGHWMWFVFPQVDLGHSPTAHHFAISSREEAEAYLDHPVLGPRLHEAVRAVGDSGVSDMRTVFGHGDAAKFRSSLTLFDAVTAPGDRFFAAALDTFFAGERDPRTRSYLESFG